MKKEEILYWSKKYDKDHQDWVQKEKELGDKIRNSKEITLQDLVEINEWKFKKTNPDRWRENLARIMRNKDADVRNITRSVFSGTLSDEDKTRMLYMKGVKNSIASVILTFHNPKEYGVFDKHVWQELFRELPQDLFEFSSNPKYYIRVLTRLREEAKEHNLSTRTTEKAYFKKNFDEARLKKKNPVSFSKNHSCSAPQ